MLLMVFQQIEQYLKVKVLFSLLKEYKIYIIVFTAGLFILFLEIRVSKKQWQFQTRLSDFFLLYLSSGQNSD